MKIRCVHRHGDKLSDALLALGNTQSTIFPVRHGREYLVFAISLWQGVIHYLVVNEDNNRPDWIPACLFEVIDAGLPFGWSFAHWRERSRFGLDAVWGYEELISQDGQHYVDLIEREPEALEVFERRRAEIENDVA